MAELLNFPSEPGSEALEALQDSNSQQQLTVNSSK